MTPWSAAASSGCCPSFVAGDAATVSPFAASEGCQLTAGATVAAMAAARRQASCAACTCDCSCCRALHAELQHSEAFSKRASNRSVPFSVGDKVLRRRHCHPHWDKVDAHSTVLLVSQQMQQKHQSGTVLNSGHHRRQRRANTGWQPAPRPGPAASHAAVLLVLPASAAPRRAADLSAGAELPVRSNFSGEYSGVVL